MENETFNNLLSGFIGALILFVLQNVVEQSTKFHYRRRTKFLLGIYLKKLKLALLGCTGSTIEMSKHIDGHRRGHNGTFFVTIVGGQDICSSTLKEARFRDYIENHFDQENVLIYYKFCDFLDHIERKTPYSLSAQYSLLSSERQLDEGKYQRETDLLLFKIDGSINDLQKAQAMCEKLLTQT